jgi:hypothetical protein
LPTEFSDNPRPPKITFIKLFIIDEIFDAMQSTLMMSMLPGAKHLPPTLQVMSHRLKEYLSSVNRASSQAVGGEQ